jgi:hypothetical protein
MGMGMGVMRVLGKDEEEEEEDARRTDSPLCS